jgi:hypothetical protein
MPLTPADICFACGHPTRRQPHGIVIEGTEYKLCRRHFDDEMRYQQELMPGETNGARLYRGIYERYARPRP